MKNLVLSIFAIVVAATVNPLVAELETQTQELQKALSGSEVGRITKIELEKNEPPFFFISESQNNNTSPFADGLATVSVDGKYGVVDTAGNVVCPIVYGSIRDVNDNLRFLYTEQPEVSVNLFHNATRQIDTTDYSAANVRDEDSSPYIEVEVGDRVGVLDMTGKQVIPPIYNSIEKFDKGLYKATLREGWGLIDTKGRQVLPFDLMSVRYVSDSTFFVQPNSDYWRVIDTKGKLIKELPEFYDIGDFSCGLTFAQTMESGDYCYLDAMGNVAIEGLFSAALGFSENLAAVKTKDEKWGYIDTAGSFVIEPQFDLAWQFSDGLALVSLGDKSGFIDKSGQLVFESPYSNAVFTQGLAPVAIGDKWGYINKEGKVAIDSLFEYANNFFNDRAWVNNGDKYACIDTTGQLITDYIFDQAFFFTEDSAAVCYNGKWGFVDKSGRMVIDAKYDYAAPYYDGMAIVKSGDCWSYIDHKADAKLTVEYAKVGYFNGGLTAAFRNAQRLIFDTVGNVVVGPKYDEIRGFNADGLASVKLKGKWGAVNRNWEMVIEPIYDEITEFSEGLSAMLIDNKWGYIDVNYKIVIEPQYDFADNFSDGLAAVVVDDKRGYINKEGVFVIEPRDYYWTEAFSCGYAVVVKAVDNSPKRGVIDSVGRVVVEPKYDWVESYNGSGLFIVGRNGKLGYVDLKGRVVIDIKYDEVSQFNTAQQAKVWVDGKYLTIDKKGRVIREL